MTIRIALFDNDPEFLAATSERLRRNGYVVYTADSATNARQILEQVWVHVAVIDIRLENDQDEGDISGIDLARDPRYETIPKIIITNYPTFEHVKATLGPRLHDLPPAVDFVAKRDGAEALIEAVEKAVATFAIINGTLYTHWEGPGLSYAALAERFASSRKTSQLVDHAAELEDLFRMLFTQSSQISIDRMLWQQRDRVALVVFAFSKGLQGRQLVVTVGQKASIQNEREKVNGLGDAGMVTGAIQPSDQKCTLHYAANTFELPGSNLELIRTFREIYQQSNTREITNVLKALGQSGSSVWSINRRIASGGDLDGLLQQRYGSNPCGKSVVDLAAQITLVGQNAESIGLAAITQSPEAFKISLPGDIGYSFPDPVTWLSSNRPVFENPVLLATTLGDLRSDTILVDSDGRTWLSDFSQLAEGPILADFAALETSIKFDLTVGENLIDLNECEQLLMAPERLNGRIESGPVPLRKAMAAIRNVRLLAVSACGDELRQYLLALAYHAVSRILSYEVGIKRARRDVMPIMHACLSLGHILKRLSELDAREKEATLQHTIGLEVDEVNRQVFVDGQPVTLTTTEYKAIHYLWQREGKLCSRADLFQAVYDRAYQQGKAASDDAQLNMLIKRVREAIESNTANPRFLITRRGTGFILYPSGRR